MSEDDFPAQTIDSSVAIFGDHLEAFLESEWPEWATSCAAIESSAGISLKKNQLAYRTATIKAEGTVPEMLEQIMKKLEDM